MSEGTDSQDQGHSLGHFSCHSDKLAKRTQGRTDLFQLTAQTHSPS